MRYPNAAQGLKLLFLGQILAILAVLLFWVPLVGFLLILASPAVEIFGIYKAGEDDEDYRGALVFAVLVFLVELVSGFFGEGFFSSVLDAASEILGLLMVFSICNTTSNLLHSLGQEELSQRGSAVIKIYTVCTAISLVCRVLGIVPIVNIAAALVSGIAGLVMVVGYVMYLLFLSSSSKVL